MASPISSDVATSAVDAAGAAVAEDARQKRDFVERHRNDYGYGGRIDGIYEHELAPRLQGAVYLDHGGSGVYTASHLTSTHEYLSRALLLNPHTDATTSIAVDNVREQVLRHVGVNSHTHTLVFTYNTSTALNLLGTIFPFAARSELAMTMDNHNSALGLREKLKACGPGARFSVVRPVDNGTNIPSMQCCCSPSLMASSASAATTAGAEAAVHPCLFVFPGESNFDGRLYNLDIAEIAHAYNYPLGSAAPADASAASRASSVCASNPLSFHHTGPQHRWYTLVDASKMLTSGPLDLAAHPGIDFATISFYKMFGFPTGLAGLIIKNSTAEELWGIGGTRVPPTPGVVHPSLSSLRSFFAGGTVNAVIADEDFHVVKSSGKLHELLEDGTLAFTTIISVPYGLQLYRALDVHAIHRHTGVLTEDMFLWLTSQRYEETQQPLCIFYGDRAAQCANSYVRFGPTLNFNFFDQHGHVIGYKTIEKIAHVNRIFIRSGSFCNPGACQLSFPLSAAQIRKNISAGYACWEDGENLGGVVNGSIRISLGWSSRWEDIHRFKQFVQGEVMHIGRQAFVSKQPTSSTLAATVAPPLPPSQDDAIPAISPFTFQLPSHFLVPTAPVALPTISAVAVVDVAPPAVTEATVPPVETGATTEVSIVAPLSYPVPSSPFVLSSLTVYPLKSCAGVPLTEWFIQSTPSGSTLFLDREFVLLDAYGVALSQKTTPKMQLIVPSVDLEQRTLTLAAPNLAPITISLADETKDASLESKGRVASPCAVQVCGQSALGYVYDGPPHANLTEWLTTAMGKYTCLARKSPQLHWPTTPMAALTSLAVIPLPSSSPTAGASFNFPSPSPTATSESTGSRPSFANEDDFLLVNAASVRDIQRRLHEYVAGHRILTASPNDALIPASRFRPNFLVDSASSPLAAFAEDSWSEVSIGPFTLTVKGGCGRCTMVNVHPETGERQSALYALLNTCRKQDGRVLFGTLLSNLRHDADGTTTDAAPEAARWHPIHVGMGCSAR